VAWNFITSPFAILTLICIVCYGNSLTCGFVFDDLSAIKDNKDIRADYPFERQFYDFLWNDFWGIPMYKEQSHKSYRPLTVLTYRVNYLLHGLHPYGYHFGNLILHIVVSLLYFITINSILASKDKNVIDNTAFIASLLFAVHPIHTEAVTGVVGRAELLSSVFFLLSALIYTNIHNKQGTTSNCSDSWEIFQCCIFSGLAIVSKEQGVTVLGFCMSYEIYQLFHHQSLSKILSFKTLKYNWKSLYRMACLSLTAILLLTFRIHLMQGSSLPVFTKYDNPASVAAPLTKALTFLLLPSYNLALLLSPSPLCCDWTMGSIPLVESLSDSRNLLTVFLFTFLLHTVLTLFRSEGRARLSLLMSLALLILPFLPATNIFFSVGFVIAERVLYLPSMGFCLLVAIGLTKLYKQCKISGLRMLIQVLLIVLISLHTCKTVLRNIDWKDEESLFLSGLKVNTNNAKLYNNVGHAFESMKRHQDALLLYQQAAMVQPDDIGAHINIGRALNHLGRPDEAETAYRAAKHLLPRGKPGEKSVARIAPNSLNLFLNLGNLISRNESRLEEADRLYRQAIAMRSDYIQAYINRGDILIKMNKTDEAMEVYKEALKHDPDNPDLYYNLGVVSIEQRNPKQGLQYMNTALRLNPIHTEALLNSAILIQELKQVENHQVAIDRLLSLVSLQPDNEKAYFNLGMVTMDEGWTWESEYWFKKAIEIVPDFRGALFNLALLLTDQHRPMDAVPYLKTLLGFYPNHTKGLILLGDIYTNIVKDLDQAEQMYKRILTVTPDHVQAKHNLCVLEVERDNLEGAEMCFQALSEEAPKEEYIRKHLRIVQNKIKKRKNERKTVLP